MIDLENKASDGVSSYFHSPYGFRMIRVDFVICDDCLSALDLCKVMMQQKQETALKVGSEVR